MSRSIRVLGLLLPFVAAVSCGGGAYTIGSACNEVGNAYCIRASECGAVSSISACKAEHHDGCCGARSECGIEVPAEYAAEFKAAVHACSGSFDDYTCEELDYYYGETYECAILYGAVVPEKFATPLTPAGAGAKPATKLVDARQVGRLSGERILKRVSSVDLAK